MPRRERARDFTVGAFVALSLLVVAVGIMAVGGQSRLFARKAEYRAIFQSADGLVVGSPVKMNGVQVGTVRAVRLSTDPGATGIEVTLGVETAYAGRVREGSQAALKFLQYLSGEKFVEVSSGDSSKAILPEDSLLPTAEGSRFLEKGEDIAENLSEITIALREILGPIQRGEGLVGQMIHDPDFGKEGLQSAKAVLDHLQDLTARLQRGEGFAGRMLFDPAMGARADDLAKSVQDLADVLARLKKGEGALGDLTSSGGKSEQAVADLREAAASLKRVAARLESKEGLVGKLLNDTEYSEQLASDLRGSLGNIRSITAKIDQGQGTLGALVNERTLHDGLEEMAAGVGDSKFARWLMRHYQKQGIKAGPAPPK